MQKKPYTLFSDAIGKIHTDCSCPTCSKMRLLYDEAVLAIGKVSDDLTEKDVEAFDNLVNSHHLPTEIKAAYHALCFTLFTMIGGAVASGLLQPEDVGGVVGLAIEKAKADKQSGPLTPETRH